MKRKKQETGDRVQRRSQESEVRSQNRGQPHILVILAILVFCGNLTFGAENPSARTSFDAGLKAFSASNYPAASNAFLEAAAVAPEEKLDPATAYYDAALAASAAGDLTAAADLFARAATSADLDLQAKAFYNRGNTLFQLAGGPATGAMPPTTPIPAPALEAAGDSIGEAVQMYENAIALNPRDIDSKANYELAILKQQEIQQQQEQQQDQEKEDENEDDSQQKQQQNQDQQKEQEKEKEQEQKQEQQQPQQPQDSEDSESQPEQAPEPSEEMTEEEAEMMLDAMKAQEQSQRDQLHPFLGRPVPVEKDW